MNTFIKTMAIIIAVLLIIGIFSENYGIIAIFLIAPAFCLLVLGLCVPEETSPTATPEIQK